MTVRVLNQMGPKLAEHLAAAGLDGAVELVAYPADAEPVEAEVLHGGWDANPAALAAIRSGTLRWVHLGAVGVEKLPAGILEAGPVFTCGHGVSGVPIAEFAVASMLGRAKRFPDVWVHEPTSPMAVPLEALADATITLIGLGDIGQETARRLVPFGARVRAFRRTHAPSPVDGVEIVTELADALRDADHVLIACPLTDATRRLIDADAFAAMKDGVHLVNVARGEIVDQDALRVALDTDKVALASLDVTYPEPLPAGHWMYEHPRVHVSPHASWSNPRYLERLYESFVANLRRYLAGEPLSGLVDAAAGY